MGHRYAFWKFLADLDDANDRAEEIMALIKLDKRRDVLAVNLTYAEAARAGDRHHHRPGRDVVLLDEPTAGMSQSETAASCTSSARHRGAAPC